MSGPPGPLVWIIAPAFKASPCAVAEDAGLTRDSVASHVPKDGFTGTADMSVWGVYAAKVPFKVFVPFGIPEGDWCCTWIWLTRNRPVRCRVARAAARKLKGSSQTDPEFDTAIVPRLLSTPFVMAATGT